MYPSESELFDSVVDLAMARAGQFADRSLYRFLTEGEADGPADRYSFNDLHTYARRIAVMLEEAGLRGQRVLLVYQPGIEFIAGFFGCLYAGAVAVPAVAPHPARPERSLPRLCAIAAEAGARAALTTTALRARLLNRIGENPELRNLKWLTSADWAACDADLWRRPELTGDTLAFLQFTSGSTGNPRGVMLSHGNLLSNLRIIGRGFAIRSTDFGIHWLPFYHDMGLIGGILETLYGGATSVFMSPLHFLQKPLRWLKAISHFQGHISGGPDFAFRLCCERVTAETLEQLDLRSWRVAFSGAETVRADTLQRFCDTFSPCGFRPASIYPCFGLAESTLFVTGGQADEPPTVIDVEMQSLAAGTAVRTEGSESARVRELVGCGKVGAGQELRIVDPETRRACTTGTVGEIWVSGPSVAQGYWGRPELTAEVFGATLDDEPGKTFLRTGDLGFVDADGELFFVGRQKDLIVVRGANHYPQDLERTAEGAHPAIRPNCVVVFAVEAAGEECVIVGCEVRPTDDSAFLREVANSIRTVIAAEHEISVYQVILLKPGGIPKTSSGKVRRSMCREQYAEGLPGEIGRFDNTGRAEAEPALAEEPATGAPATGLERRIIELVAGQLGVDPAEIGPTSSFARFGLDSLRAVAVSGLLETETGRKLSPALLYNYPTARALARYLEGNAGAAVAGRRRDPGEPVAIVGMSCRFPGQANDPDSYWRMLLDGFDAIAKIPPARVWQDDLPQWGGWLDDIDLFDPAAFGISAREAAGIDPQQRLVLEVAAEALEHAGIVPESLAGQPVGVFIGVSSSDYAWWCLKNSPIDAWSGTGNAHSICANRLSYLYDLRGPSMAIDTACSSSLVGLHEACMSLRSGETSMAIVGGVNAIITTHTSEAFAMARMLAPDGRCKTFDAAADGYVRGEGCGVAVLKLLDDAIRDGDRVIAVIRGTAVNQDGRSNGLTAPNGDAQRQVIESALADAGISADVLGYVEAHGTGTPLGDPIELEALAAVLGERRNGARCVVGAVKTNIGHLEPASGMASLIKTALMLERGAIPPHLNLRRINPAIDPDTAPYRFPIAGEEWPGWPGERFAGINSFGFGGTNAHVILSGAPPAPASTEPECGIQVLALSARSEPLLRRLALRVAVYLENRAGLRLADVTRSANLGRTHREFRLAIPACSVAELACGLRRYAETPEQSAAYTGRAAAGEAPPVDWICPDLETIDPDAAVRLRDADGAFRRTLESIAPEFQAVSRKRQALQFQLAIAEQLKSWGLTPAHVRSEGSGAATAAVLGGVVSRTRALEVLECARCADFPPALQETPGALTVSLGCATGDNPARAMREQIARLFVAGVPIDWAAVDGRDSAPKIALPFSPFERTSHWKGPKGVSRAERTVVEVGLDAQPWLRDHRVFDQPVAPAAWYIDRLIRIAQQHLGQDAVALRNLRLLRPLTLPSSGESVRVEFRVDWKGALPRISAVIAESAEALVEAGFESVRSAEAPKPRAPRLLDSGEPPMTHAEFYGLMTAAGLQYGPAFRWPGDVQRRPGLAETRLSEKLSVPVRERVSIHPGVLDSLFQTIGGAVESLDRKPEAWVPVSVERLVFYGSPAALEGVWTWAEAALEGENTVQGDARLLDSAGCTIVGMNGVRLSRIAAGIVPAASPKPAGQYEVCWEPLTTAVSRDISFVGSRILLLSDTGDGARIAEALKLHGYEASVSAPGIAPAELAASRPDVVARCWPPAPAGDLAAAERAGRNVLEVVNLAKNLAAWSKPPALYLIACGSETADPQDPAPDPALGALSGLCRTIAIEHPELECGIVDLDPFAPDPFAAAGAAIEALQRSGEVVLAVRRGTWLAPRLHPVENKPAVRESRRLSMASHGVLGTVQMVPSPRRAPGPDEVEIEVCAVALNFRDILQALDMIPGYGVFGGECSGRVVRTGERVEHLRPGAEVVAALASEGCAAEFVTLPAANVLPKPAGLNFAVAAAVPMAFMTALYGLRDIARLGAGDRVLIHAGAGGVGFAAVQIALREKLEVFATAGSPEKRSFLKSLGVPHVFDSRSLDFSAQILSLTEGRGVDAVLNSLAGPFIPAGMDCLRPGGIFLELGKREIYSPERLRAEARGLIYKPYDLITISVEQPAVFRALFQEVLDQVASGRLPAPPLKAFSMANATGAFRFMAQARHIGKVVLLPEGRQERTLVRSGVYLITGGTGALGLKTAEWLAGLGAERLVLTARREPGAEVRERLLRMQASGTACELIQADVSSMAEMTALFAGIDAGGAPLRGIVHCAGVLEDGLIQGLEHESVERVLAPKIEGAWNLHLLTRHRALDFFVLYSSASAVFGNRGQAVYAAGNAFLDSLAECRASTGLAASSIAWGPWDGPGMADNPLSRATAAAAGVTPLKADEGLDALADVVRGRPALRVMMNFDAARLAPHLGRNANLLGESVSKPVAKEAPAAAPPAKAAFRLSADPAQRRKDLARFLEEKVRASLDLSADSPLDSRAQLTDIGLDSLMAVELRSAVSTELGYDLPPALLAEGATLDALTDHLAAAFAPAEVHCNGASPQADPAGDVREGPERFWSRMQPALDRVALARSLNLYHFEKPIASYEGGAWVRCSDGERRLMLATHCYLGLLSHPRIRQSVLEAVERFGGGMHGSRLMGGCLELHQRLERKIAEFNGREAAIAVSTGYVTNTSAIAALVGEGDWVISDQRNHASILDGCKASGALFRVYKHNNLEDLESVLRAAPVSAVKLVVADGVFSMDGDIADLPGLSGLCRKYGALLMIDEAHSLGVLGKTGRGIEEHFDMPGAVDILMGTLSKTLSSMGGYITGSRRLIDFLRLSARGYFFSTSPPAPVIAASLAALEVLEEEGPALCARLRQNTAIFIEGLQAAGFDTGTSCTAIVPAILGSDEKAARLADYGQRHGLFVLPALPPAVPVGTARLRLTVSAAHTPEELRGAVATLARGARELYAAAAAVA